MTAKGIFVTGTDTGVGKTVVCAAILSRMRADGMDAVPMKPVHTGCTKRNGALIAPDLELTLAAAGCRPSPEEMDWMAPYRFEPACSPHLAAALASQAISLDYIHSCYCALAAQHATVVVEGAGGLLVPLGNERSMLDLMVMLKLPVVLVARPGLGTINHTLLSLRELKRAGLRTLGVVFCETAPSPDPRIDDDNRRTIAHLAGPISIWRLPFTPGLENGWGAASTGCAAWSREMPTTHDLLGEG